MRRLFYLIPGICICLAACKKEADTDDFPFESDNYNSELVAINADANKLLSLFMNDPDTICGVSEILDSAEIHKYVVTINGYTCNNTLYRQGKITLQLMNAASWYTQDAEVKITFTDFEITPVNTGMKVVLNGERIFKNLSGDIDIYDLVAGGPGLQKLISSNGLSMTYSDGTQRTWNESMIMTTIKNPDWDYEFSIQGNATGLPYENVAHWGSDREGKEFFAVHDTPVRALLCNGAWKTYSGLTTTYHEDAGETTIVFGVNPQGEAVTDYCFPYGMKIIWIDDEGVVHVTIRPYL